MEVALTGSERAKVSPVRLHSGKVAFLEVGFPGETIYPGNIQLASRTLKLRLTALSWDEGNDWSASGLVPESKLLPRLAVYEGGKLLGGNEP